MLLMCWDQSSQWVNRFVCLFVFRLYDGSERKEAQHLHPGTHGHRRLPRPHQTHPPDLRLLPPPVPHLPHPRLPQPRRVPAAVPQPRLGGLGNGRVSPPVSSVGPGQARRGRVPIPDQQRGHVGGDQQLRQRRLQWASLSACVCVRVSPCICTHLFNVTLRLLPARRSVSSLFSYISWGSKISWLATVTVPVMLLRFGFVFASRLSTVRPVTQHRGPSQLSVYSYPSFIYILQENGFKIVFKHANTTL